MTHIKPITDETANEEQLALFGAIRAQLGSVPNFLKVLANSPTALKAFLGLYGITHGGSLSVQTGERIAVALAQENSCEYCLSAHSAFARKAGLDSTEIDANRQGSSQDAKAAVAVGFARSLVEHMGDVTKADIQQVRAAGYSDAEIVEMITHVAMNLFTNILAKACRIDIDFPKLALDVPA